MYLLDTDVLSELRAEKRRRNPNVIAWFKSIRDEDVFLSAITIAEIEFGIERQRTVNPAFAERLASWLADILGAFGERVLPLSVRIAYRWGRLGGEIGNTELDLAIAATALEHGLAVVTGNESHFRPAGVAIENPFSSRGAARKR